MNCQLVLHNHSVRKGEGPENRALGFQEICDFIGYFIREIKKVGVPLMFPLLEFMVCTCLAICVACMHIMIMPMEATHIIFGQFPHNIIIVSLSHAFPNKLHILRFTLSRSQFTHCFIHAWSIILACM